MQLTFQHGSERIALQVEPDGDGWRVRLPDGTEHRIEARRLPGDWMEISEGARVFQVPFAHSERGAEFSWAGESFVFTAPTGKAGGSRKASSGALSAPMSGVVADVLVTVGQGVEAYQPLVVVEAMKVYATVEAPFAGTVTAVAVHKGQRVEQGASLAEIVPAVEETP